MALMTSNRDAWATQMLGPNATPAQKQALVDQQYAATDAASVPATQQQFIGSNVNYGAFSQKDLITMQAMQGIRDLTYKAAQANPTLWDSQSDAGAAYRAPYVSMTPDQYLAAHPDTKPVSQSDFNVGDLNRLNNMNYSGPPTDYGSPQNATNINTTNAAYEAAANARQSNGMGGKIANLAGGLVLGGLTAGLGSAYIPGMSSLTGFSPVGSDGLTGMAAGSGYASGGVIPDWAGSGQTSALDAAGTSGLSAAASGSASGLSTGANGIYDFSGLSAGAAGGGAAAGAVDTSGGAIFGMGGVGAGNGLYGAGAGAAGLAGAAGVAGGAGSSSGGIGSLFSAGGALGNIGALASGVGSLATLASGVGALTGQGLTGGGKTASTASGWDAIPGFDQTALTGLVNSGAGLLNGAGGAAMYAPMPLTPDELTAQKLSQPMTQQGVTDLTNNYMNPFNDFLMKNIQNTATGINSNYQGQVSGSGFAPGTTNRDFLNTGYNQGQEDLAIGTTSAGEYNNALTAGLGQQNANVSQLMGMGANQRAIGLQTQQAPISALNALGGLTGYIPNSSQGQSKETPNQLLNLGSLLNGAQTGLTSLSNYFNNPRGSTGGTSSFFG